MSSWTSTATVGPSQSTSIVHNYFVNQIYPNYASSLLQNTHFAICFSSLFSSLTTIVFFGLLLLIPSFRFYFWFHPTDLTMARKCKSSVFSPIQTLKSMAKIITANISHVKAIELLGQTLIMGFLLPKQRPKSCGMSQKWSSSCS